MPCGVTLGPLASGEDRRLGDRALTINGSRLGGGRVLRLSVLGAVAIAAVFAVFSSTASALRWSAPLRMPMNIPESVSCPSTSECFVGTSQGLLFSSDPAPSASAWQLLDGVAAQEGPVTEVAQSLVSCPSASFCAATGGYSIWTSTSPAQGASAWHRVALHLPGTHPLGGLACGSPDLCVAYQKYVDTNNTGPGPTGGRVFSTTNPTGGAGAWKMTVLRDVPDGVYCVPTACVLATLNGDVLSSTHPTLGAGAWRTVHVSGRPGARFDMTMIACATTSYCLTADTPQLLCSELWRTDDPFRTTAFSWTFVNFGFDQCPSRFALFVGGTCVSSGFCAVIADTIKGFVGAEGTSRVFWSAGPHQRWTNSAIAIPNVFGISCASSHLCVAVGNTATMHSRIAYGRLVVGRG